MCSIEDDLKIFKESAHASKSLDPKDGGRFRKEYSESILPHE